MWGTACANWKLYSKVAFRCLCFSSLPLLATVQNKCLLNFFSVFLLFKPWVRANSGRQWRTGKPGMRLFMGSQSQTGLSDCVTPQTAAHQAPPSLGFSRQEYWSGLPFPSPMHESEKWKWSRFSCARLLATPWTAAYQAPPSMGFSRQEYWSGVPSPSPINTTALSSKFLGIPWVPFNLWWFSEHDPLPSKISFSFVAYFCYDIIILCHSDLKFWCHCSFWTLVLF